MLVCERNHQIEGIDEQATYALTAHLADIKLVVTFAANVDLEIHRMDVCTAFLGVYLQEEIYIHPLLGYFHLHQTGSQY
jgi:hypothetical protein